MSHTKKKRGIVGIGANGGPARDIGLTGDARTMPLVQEVAEVLLFSDARASDGMPAGDDPRGWWHDTYTDEPTGSTIWTFRGAPLSDDTLRGVEQAAERALAVMVSDGLCASVSAEASRSEGRLHLDVTITRGDGTAETLTWPDVWAGV
jgi:phage gp46-like protein